MTGPTPDRRAPHRPEPNAPGGTRRVLWFAAFYGMSLAVFTALVYALRFVVRG